MARGLHYWDDSIREPAQRKERHVLRPEISRTFHLEPTRARVVIHLGPSVEDSGIDRYYGRPDDGRCDTIFNLRRPTRFENSTQNQWKQRWKWTGWLFDWDTWSLLCVLGPGLCYDRVLLCTSIHPSIHPSSNGVEKQLEMNGQNIA